MFLVEFDIDDSEFQEWIGEVKSNFYSMVQTMMDVAYLIQANTYMNVPLDTGRLEESFTVKEIESSSDFIEVHAVYDAVDPRDGFHYAEVQHEELGFYHPRRGEALYLLNGIWSSEDMAMRIIESDFLSLFG